MSILSTTDCYPSFRFSAFASPTVPRFFRAPFADQSLQSAHIHSYSTSSRPRSTSQNTLTFLAGCLGRRDGLCWEVSSVTGTVHEFSCNGSNPPSYSLRSIIDGSPVLMLRPHYFPILISASVSRRALIYHSLFNVTANWPTCVLSAHEHRTIRTKARGYYAQTGRSVYLHLVQRAPFNPQGSVTRWLFNWKYPSSAVDLWQPYK
ncbi:hypothetical protein B0H17DRAFT_357710 [Mycena rosella]|uniref:Uncharacterized protein n=1 Tax=Mycena rosella TaxID=1033263 RepID=A0AAD7G178_MYCRO|nr:hypothetical protein B0H17DRAFT_357710 [Mycena rosella]